MNAQGRNLLAVEGLSVSIQSGNRTARAVEGVSLTLERGRTLALVGESGSGKSILCRSLMGLLPRSATIPESARVMFEGHDLTRLSEKELNRIRGKEIGIVLQNPLSSLNPVLTVGEQLMEPMRHHLGLSVTVAKGRALELLTAVGIPQPEDRLKCHPHQLSGGMRQRVAIAIAIACDPKLLIADEPTTALDVTVQAEILNLLGRLQRERGMAMILVSHNLAVVANRAHETAVMYAGRIVEQAATGELFQRMAMPYTRALLHAVPQIDDPPHRHLEAIGGHTPDLSLNDVGCSFAPRCPQAKPCCCQDKPPLQADRETETHRYACWFPHLEDRDEQWLQAN